MRKLLTAALTALACTTAVQAAQEINFGIISTESAAHLKADWQPVLDDMEKKTGYKVKAYFASDYAGIIEGMRFKKVDVAWMGNKSGIEAVDRAGGEVFAQTTYADGSLGYWSLLITQADSPYKSVDDVLKNGKDINFGLGDPNSTSGTAVPGYYVFAMNNIDPRTHFKTARHSNHEANLMAVANGQVDVATNNTEALEKFTNRSPELAKKIRVIWKSPLIPADPMVWRSDLDKTAKDKIKDFFLSYGQGDSDAAKAELANMKKLTFGVFRDSSNAQLIPIRQIELAKAKIKLEADDKMSADEKKAKIAEIDKQLADLLTQVAAAK
ncbi:phosphonate ABC transporter substrate-binding protein [Azoarcus sp. L1K30]|uniref:phosphonate ABC transporter substrate-binding protein n=1 Tax=Azoarcus sp. L1K30 TaxID=2820277 RepID=UPI001B8271B1|nr:phosphonate ABC transporter substrate-binding protein [Azoarcus sp. L1K30]MBR0568197.1 phosphonate ABC transporter substrate-binding protein [Azoarcus sp. L1K30]